MEYLILLFFCSILLEFDTSAAFFIKMVVIFGLSIDVVGVVESFALAKTCFKNCR